MLSKHIPNEYNKLNVKYYTDTHVILTLLTLYLKKPFHTACTVYNNVIVICLQV